LKFTLKLVALYYIYSY